MKRKIKRIAYIACLLIITILFDVTADDQFCDSIDLHWLRLHATIPSSEIVSKKNHGGICEVVLRINGAYLPLYAGRDFFIAGVMYQNYMQPTKARIEEFKKVDFIKSKETLDKAVAFEYTPANFQDRTIYMFTDPLCPYCAKAGEEIRPIADHYGAKVKILFHNVHGPEGKRKVIETICRELTFDTYMDESWKNDNHTDEFQCEKGEKLYILSTEQTRKLGINSVPQFYLDDGTSITGADMSALEEALSALISNPVVAK